MWPRLDPAQPGLHRRGERRQPRLCLSQVETDLCLLQAPRLVISDNDLREELRKINSNSRLSELYLALARDLDVMEAKTPEEVGWEAKLPRESTESAVWELLQQLAARRSCWHGFWMSCRPNLLRWWCGLGLPVGGGSAHLSSRCARAHSVCTQGCPMVPGWCPAAAKPTADRCQIGPAGGCRRPEACLSGMQHEEKQGTCPGCGCLLSFSMEACIGDPKQHRTAGVYSSSFVQRYLLGSHATSMSSTEELLPLQSGAVLCLTSHCRCTRPT